MGIHCINRSGFTADERERFANIEKILGSERLAKAACGVWQEDHNTDRVPDYEELIMSRSRDQWGEFCERYDDEHQGEVDVERDIIRVLSLVDGTFMRAPNGKPTRLTEQGWLEVRTKAYKEKHGDWERGAEMELDENGEPMVLGKGIEAHVRTGNLNGSIAANERLSAMLLERLKAQGIEVELIGTDEMRKRLQELGVEVEKHVGEYGRWKAYNNRKYATEGQRKRILEKIKDKRYTTAGTDAVLVGGTIYLIDHSADSELQANLEEGGDGFGIREKFNKNKLTKDDIRRILRNVAGDYGYSETRVRQMLQDIGITSGHLRGIDLSAELKVAVGTNVSLDSSTRRQGNTSGNDRSGRDGSDRQESLGQEAGSHGRGVELMRTSEGEVYGFVHGGKIYIDREKLNPNTLLHEYTHLWCKAVQQGNPELWSDIKQMLRNDKLAIAIGRELRLTESYRDLSSDRMLSEVISRLSGAEGRERLERIQQQLYGDTKSLFEKFVDSLRKLWGWVGKSLFGVKHIGSLDELVDRVLYDLVSGGLREEGAKLVEERESVKAELVSDEELNARRDHFRQLPRVVMEQLIRMSGKEPPVRSGSIMAHRTCAGVHFGNPWSSNVADQENGYLPASSAEEAVQNYIDWLTGVKFHDVEPHRRRWIVDNIVSGVLKDKTIICAESNVTTHASALHYLIHRYDWASEEVSDESNVVRFSNLDEKKGLGPTDGHAFYLSDFLANLTMPEVRKAILEALEGMTLKKVEVPSVEVGMLISRVAMSDVKDKGATIMELLESKDSEEARDIVERRCGDKVSVVFGEGLTVAGMEDRDAMRSAYRAYFLTGSGRAAYAALDGTGTTRLYSDKGASFPYVGEVLAQVRDEIRQERGERRKAVKRQRELMRRGPDAITNEEAVMLAERMARLFTEAVSLLERDLPDNERSGSTLATRRYIIMKKYGPANIMKQVCRMIEERYCNEGNVRTRIDLYYDTAHMPEEDIREAVETCLDLGRSMLEFKDALFLMANSFIKQTEGISITDSNGEVLALSEYETDRNEEEVTKHDEGWMNDVGSQSAAELVDREIRIIESNLFHMHIGQDGRMVLDLSTENISLLVEPVPYDFNIVHNEIIRTLNYVKGAEDMLPALEKLGQRYDWAQQLVHILCGIDTPHTHIYERMTEEQRQRKAMNLQAKFWRSNHKSFMRMASMNKGELTMLNTSSGEKAAMEQIRNTILSHSQRGKRRVYDSDGNINDKAYDTFKERYWSEKNKVNREILFRFGAYRSGRAKNEVHEKVGKKFKDMSDQEWREVYHETALFASEMLESIGVDLTSEAIESILQDPTLNDQQKSARLVNIMSPVAKIYARDAEVPGYIRPEDRIPEKRKENKRKKREAQNLFNKFYTAYKKAAQAMANYVQAREESMAFYTNEKGLNRKFSNIFPTPIIEIFGLLGNKGGLSEKEYKAMLEERYLHNWWFRNKAYGIRNLWLEILYGDAGARADFDVVELVLSNGISYENENEGQSLNTRIDMFLNGYYGVPTPSDKHHNFFIKAPVYNIEEFQVDYNDIPNMSHPVMKALRNVFVQELERIKVVENRAAAYERGEQISLDANYDMRYDKDGNRIAHSGGARFFFFKAVNRELDEIISQYEDKKNNNPDEVIDRYLRLALKREYDYFRDYFEKNGIKGFAEKESYDSILINYFYNNFLAQTQIIELTMIDPAFLENEDKFQKRYAMFTSPVQTAYNTFYLLKDGRLELQPEGLYKSREYSIILKDDIRSEKEGNGIKSLEICRRFLEAAVKKGYITKKQAELSYSNLTEINASDAQAYRTLPSREQVMNMMGNASNPRIHEVIRRIISGEFTRADFDVWFTDEKPFVCGYENMPSHYGDGTEAQYADIITPLQHKNSEFPLLAIYEAISWEMSSPKLRALNQFMVDHGIDKAHFESSTKTGIRGCINLTDLADDDYEGVYHRLEKMTGMSQGVMATEDGEYDHDVVHSMPFNYWGISVNNPEHNLSHPKSSMGTQLIKKLMEDLMPEDMVTVNGMSLTRDQWLQLYKEIFIANLVESLREVNDKITDVKALSVLLKDMVNKDSRYQPDLLDHLELNDDETGFRIPLFDPIVSEKIEAMLSSVLRNRCTKQYVRQAQLIQVGSFGFELDAHFVDADGNEVTAESGTEADHLKSVDTAMPIFDRNMLMFVREDGSVDYKALREKCDPKIFETLNYRIPTEAKHSIFCGRVKYLLPLQNASVCMVPPFFIAVSDSDNDNDKNNVMIYETEVEWDMERIKEDYAKVSDWMTYGEFLAGIKASGSHKYVRRIRPVGYKTNGSFRSLLSAARNSSRTARNNMLLDMCRGVMQTTRNSALIMNPGGFLEASRVMTVMKVLLNKENHIEDYRKLLEMGEKEMEKYSMNLESCSIANPAIRSIQQVRNMTGANLLTVFAATAPLLTHLQEYRVQGGKITVKKNYIVNINGNRSLPMQDGTRDFSLGKIRNMQGMYISDNMSQMLGAAADNAKKNVMYFLGQNRETVNITVAMLIQGYSIMETALLLMHPKAQEIVKLASNSRKKSSVLGECIKYMKKVRLDSNLAEIAIKEFPLDSVEMAKAIHGDSSAKMHDEVIVATLYRLAALGKALSDLNNVLRADTQSGSANSSHITSLYNQLKLEKLRGDMKDRNYPLDGTDLFITFDENNPSRNNLSMQFFQYGVQSLDNLAQGLTLPYNDVVHHFVRDIINFCSIPITEKNVQYVYERAVSYLVSGAEVQARPTVGGSHVSAEEYRRFLVFTLPSIINRIKRDTSHPLHDNILFNALTANERGDLQSDEVPYIHSSNSQRSNYFDTARCKAGWSWMLEEPEGVCPYTEGGVQKSLSFRELSDALVAYSFMMDGVIQGGWNFIKYFPSDSVEDIPGYVKFLQKLGESTDGKFVRENYKDMFFVVDQMVANDPGNEIFAKIVDKKSLGNIKGDMLSIGIIPTILKGTGLTSPYLYFGSNMLYKYNVFEGHYELMNMLGNNGEMQEFEYGKSPVTIEETEPIMKSVLPRNTSMFIDPSMLTDRNKEMIMEIGEAIADEDIYLDEVRLKTVIGEINSKLGDGFSLDIREEFFSLTFTVPEDPETKTPVCVNPNKKY